MKWPITWPTRTSNNQEYRIQDEEAFEITVPSYYIHPCIGCPVMCHRLKKALPLNGKIGDLRDGPKDCGNHIRQAVYFEDKNLKKPVLVKSENLCVVFELPGVEQIHR